MDAYNTEDTERNGTEYRIEYYYDEDHNAPWIEEDGHGIISEWTTRDKHPGEVAIATDGRSHRYYDVAATIDLAKRDGWGVSSDTTGMTPAQVTEEAVEQDMKQMREWCNSRWHYMGIVVFPLTVDGDELRSKSKSLWGIESDSEDEHLASVVNDLISEVQS